jgi:putative ABC transport system permease protein
MGATSGTLLKMIVVQAVMVGCIGYGLGVGGASWFYFISKKSELAFFLPWQLLLIVGGAVVFICVLAAILSMIKVIKLDPAVVFRS